MERCLREDTRMRERGDGIVVPDPTPKCIVADPDEILKGRAGKRWETLGALDRGLDHIKNPAGLADHTQLRKKRGVKPQSGENIGEKGDLRSACGRPGLSAGSQPIKNEIRNPPLMKLGGGEAMLRGGGRKDSLPHLTKEIGAERATPVSFLIFVLPMTPVLPNVLIKI